jgi:molybdopterin converting factor small subunit
MTVVKVHGQNVPEALRQIEVVPDNDDVSSLLQKLVKAYPELQEILLNGVALRTDMGILINGRHCMFMDGLKTRIKESDAIDIIMPVIGG